MLIRGSEVPGGRPKVKANMGALKFGRNIGRPLLRLALSSAIYWVGRKIVQKVGRGKGQPDGEEAGAMFMTRVKDKAIDTITESVISGLLKEPEPVEKPEGLDKILTDHLGKGYRGEEGLEFNAWQKSMMRVMFHRFWHDPQVETKLTAAYSVSKTTQSPEMIPIRVGRDREEAVWKEAVVAGWHSGGKVVVKLQIADIASFGSMVCYAKTEESAKRFVGAYGDYALEYNYLKGLALGFDGSLLDASDCPTWEDIILPVPLKDKIENHTLGFLGELSEIRRRGLRTSRGNLWIGPPGTGKTMASRILAGESQERGGITFVGVPAPSLRHWVGDVARIFQMARVLSPTLLFLDDLDRAEEDILDSLLGELDGQNTNDGVVVVATINNPDCLGVALKDRPGRFDVAAYFDLPDASMRRQLFEHFTASISGLKGEYVDRLVEGSEGFSPVHCEEVIRRTVIEGICLGEGGTQFEHRLFQSLEAVQEQHWRLRDGTAGSERESEAVLSTLASESGR